MIANAIPLLTILFFRQASSQTFLRSASSSSIESGFDDNSYPCSDHASYEGKWELLKAYDDDNEVSIPSGEFIIFGFLKKDSPDEYDLSINAANVFGTSISIIHTTGQTDKCSDNIDVGLVRSTQMLPPVEFRDIEDFLSAHLENMMVMEIFEKEGSHILVMSGDNANIICKSILRFPVNQGKWEVAEAKNNDMAVSTMYPIYQGQWKVTEAKSNDIAVSLPDDDAIIIQIGTDESIPTSYNWYAKATNSFYTVIDIVGKGDGFDLIQVGNIASTMMIPMEKHEDIEKFFNTALVGMDKMSEINTEEGGKTLEMKSDTAMIRCEKIVPDTRVYDGKWKLTKASDVLS